MRPVLTPAESARLDAAVPTLPLMERAGLAVASAAGELGAGYGTAVVVLAGPGNNGGDGYVAARRLLSRGAGVEVVALAEPRTAAAAAAAGAAREAGVPVRGWSGPGRRVDLVIDALFGGGFRGGLPGGVEEWIARGAPVVAVDVPSGLDPLTGEISGVSFVARRTVTFHALRPGHVLGAGPDVCGEVVVADIGLRGGEPSFLAVDDDDAPRPSRPRRAHKWSAGSVLVVGGGEGMVGAAVLAGRAALSFGAGAVGVASPSPALVQTVAPELLAYPIDALPARFGVRVVGPGLGPRAADVVAEALARPGPLVLDADALTAVPVEAIADARADVVVTPHEGELVRLLGELPAPADLPAAAGRLGAVVVAKGNPTLVTDGGVPRVVTSNGPELATIGTGDVLAGMIAALIARGLSPFDAAVSAAHWHGRAGAALAAEGAVTADLLARGVGRFAWERP